MVRGVGSSRMDGFKRGEVARAGGVNLETIRYYERRGLLPKPPRTTSGYRTFGADAVRRLRFIKNAQDLGFSLREIKELLALRLDARTSCADVRWGRRISPRGGGSGRRPRPPHPPSCGATGRRRCW